MPDLQWVPGADGESELRDAAGHLYGTATPLWDGGWRAFFLGLPGDDPFEAWLAGVNSKHPTEAGARAWVEAEVARRGGETDALSTFGGEG